MPQPARPPARRAPPPAAAAAAKKDDNEKKTVITPIGTAAFLHVWEPFAFAAQPDDKPKEPNYSLILVFDMKQVERDPAQSAAWKALRGGVTAAAYAKFGEQGVKDLLKRNKFSLPWRDGPEYEQYGPPFEDGTKFISVKSRNPPGVVDARSRPILNQEDAYPGMLARVSCFPWAFDSMGNKGVTLLLNNVQKAGEGERLAGGRVSAEAEFEPLEEGGDDNFDGEDLLG